MCRADQRSLEERRNTINLKEAKKEKKKKTKEKEDKEGRKEKKHKKRDSLTEVVDQDKERKKEKKNKRKGSEGDLSGRESNNISPNSSETADISPEAAKVATESDKPVDCDTEPFIEGLALAERVKDHLCDKPSEPSCSPAPPAETRKKKSLCRDKSLKRVSFEEQPSIIGGEEVSVRTDLVAIVDEAVGETADEVFDSVEVVESDLPPL